MDQSIVLFFDPYKGTVKNIAAKAAEILYCDAIEIIPELPYSKNDLRLTNPFSRVHKEYQRKETVFPKEINIDLSKYDIICLCFPMWYQHPPQIISSFADKYIRPSKYQRLMGLRVLRSFTQSKHPLVSFFVQDFYSQNSLPQIEYIATLKGLKKIASNLKQYDPLSKYKNHQLEYLSPFDEITYPLDMGYNNNSAYPGTISSGYAFRNSYSDDIEYVMITSTEGMTNYLSAYKQIDSVRVRVGAAYYYTIKDTGDIYLRSLFVLKEYRGHGIARNIIKTMILAEHEVLSRGNNLFVHAFGSPKRFENELTLSELESFYLRYGFTLVSNEGDVTFGKIKATSDSRSILENRLTQLLK